MAKKIKAIKDDLLRYTAFIQESLDKPLAEEIGKEVVLAMLQLISRGISPIEGAGRFPAYKWAEFRNNLKKERGSVTKALRKNKKSLFVLRRKNQRQLLQLQKNANKKQLGALSGKYPFTPEAIALGKKPRPVNLHLTGDFLNQLRSVVIGTAGKMGLEIGFFPGSRDANGVEASVKEQGHREGANGQPQRPIIPINTEDFNQSIQNAIFEKIGDAIDRAARAGLESSL